MLGLPFIYANLSFLVVVGFIPILIYLKALQGEPKKYAYLNLFFALFIFQAMVMAWMLDTSPSRWLPIDQNQANLLVLAIWLFSTLVLSSGTILFSIAAKHLNKYKLSESHWIVSLAVLWAASEYARAVIVSIVSIGEGSSIGPYWNYGALGYLGVNLPISFASRLVGLFGLSFLIILVNFGVYKLFTKQYRQSLAWISPVLVLALFGYITYHDNKITLEVAAAHIGINNTSKPDSLSIQSAVGDKSYDLAVFPEYVDPSAGDNLQILKTSDLINDGGAIVGGRQQRETYPSENLLVNFDENGNEVESQEKSFIVPYGEYLPYIVDSVLGWAGLSELSQKFEDQRQVIAGSEQIEPVAYSNFNLGGQVCSGITSPSLYNYSARQGATILSNSASLAIFAFSPQYHQESLSMAKFHAIANSRPYVQSTYAGQSLILTADGQIVAETKSPSKEIQVISGTVSTRDRRTISSILGDFTIVLLALPLAVIVYQKRASKRRS